MKALLLAFALVTSSAFASELLIHSKLNSSGPVRGNFKVHEASGKAWVELTYQDHSVAHVQVPGLYVHADVMTLVKNGSAFECAVAQKATGLCQFVSRKETKVVNDRFQSGKLTFLNTYLVIGL